MAALKGLGGKTLKPNGPCNVPSPWRLNGKIGPVIPNPANPEAPAIVMVKLDKPGPNGEREVPMPATAIGAGAVTTG